MAESKHKSRKEERGSTLVEFAIAATVFLTVLFAVLEFGRALWVHNALADAARRGARYAVLHAKDKSAVQRVVMYGDPAGGTTPVVDNLVASNVDVHYSDEKPPFGAADPNFGLNTGAVSVSINNYQFQFALPLGVTSIQMPNYTTTLTAECAGLIP